MDEDDEDEEALVLSSLPSLAPQLAFMETTEEEAAEDVGMN